VPDPTTREDALAVIAKYRIDPPPAVLKHLSSPGCETPKPGDPIFERVQNILIATPQGLRAFGAGILSSAGELPYSVASPEPRRVGFGLQRLMRSRYRIDTFQATYFVIDSFQQLFDATAPDFTPIYAEVRGRIAREGEIEAGTVLPGERRFNP
jgi:hypothetical protein